MYKNALLITEIPVEESAAIDLSVRKVPLLISLPLILISFLVLDNNTFTFFNVLIWFLAIFFAVKAFWIPQKRIDFKALGQKVITYISKPFINLQLSSWSILVIAVFLLAAFFHLSKIDTVPLNMTSDHAEKLVDVQSVLNGKYSIFMANNGGREPMQFYLVAAMIKWFRRAGINFTTLKLRHGAHVSGRLDLCLSSGQRSGQPLDRPVGNALYGFRFMDKYPGQGWHASGVGGCLCGACFILLAARIQEIQPQ